MAYAIAYDWEKVTNPPLFLYPFCDKWYSDAISTGLFGHGGWSSQQGTHPPTEGGRNQKETKEVALVVVLYLRANSTCLSRICGGFFRGIVEVVYKTFGVYSRHAYSASED
jgi:hypothetical protein